VQPPIAVQPPIIDISGLVAGDRDALARVASQIEGPAAEWGVFHVAGHGIAEDQLARFDDAMHRFFDQPRDVKLQLRRTRDNARGFYDEELTKNQPDWKEVFDYGAERSAAAASARHSDGVNQWPEGLPGFREAMVEHFDSCVALADALLRGICVSLGIVPDALAEEFANHTGFVRLNRYAACADPAPPDAPFFPESGALGVHHHTDAGLLTILYQDDVAGLQAWHDDRFVVIEPVSGALTVDLGDMLTVWSNDRYHSPLHRVLAHESKTRHSAPFFYNPNYETTCMPIREIFAVGERSHYRPISWGHFRDQRSAGDYADYGDEIQIGNFRVE
jgi:isopenicillin N synthase-like dioxygenase